MLTVASMLAGYSISARSIWDAIAFETFAQMAFERFETLRRQE